VLANDSIFEGRYELLGQLGEGSFGRIYKARQLSTGQHVAIKTVRVSQGDAPASVENQIGRFRREMRLCAELSHPNIVRLIDSGESHDGVLYAVFEYVPGSTLQELLATAGRLEWETARRLMSQVLDALACAHARGVVHRDLKPANIMVTRTGAQWNAMVLDFGLGGFARDAEGWSLPRLTATRELLGTPSYAAPEQLTGQPPSTRSDLYAWGLILLECLTGEPAISGSSLHEVVLRQLDSEPVTIPPVIRNGRLRRLLHKVTAKQVERRDVTIDSLLQTLSLIDAEELPGPGSVAFSDAISGATSGAFEGERRRLTVLFCDLVDSTELSARLDPEEFCEIIRAYQRTAEEEVARFGGRVGKYLGDGLLVYFGWPKAHEDDVERAVRAGLAIPGAISALNERLPAGLHLAVRVGIHTGSVVVSEDVFGETPNVAARVEAAAGPGTVVITAATQRLVAGLFLVEDLGPQQLRGLGEPVTLYRVVQPSGMRSRLELAEGRLTPFVGREAELGTLLASWERTEEGEGQTVLVSGEAGVGKSRLVYQLREQITSVPHTWLECRGTPYTQGAPFYPVIELFQKRLGLTPDDLAPMQIARLEGSLARMKVALDETVPLIAQFLSLPLPEGYSPLQMSPELQRRKTIELLAAWILGLADTQPLVLLAEDLHWYDPSSLELLGRVIEQSPAARILLVGTARPEFAAPWPTRWNLMMLPVARLTKRQTREMVTVLGGDELPAETIDTLVSRAGGVPLYIEELTKVVMEPGAPRVGAIPDTLADLLMARLDRLSTAKEVAQGAAVLGREFPYVLLAAVVGMPEAALRDALGRLVEAEILFVRGEPPSATYSFKHALLQEAAYESLLKRTRKQFHARVAATFKERFPQRAAAEPAVLAHHCEAGGMLPEAIEAYRHAGDLAAARLAYPEAQSDFARALELLSTLPEDAAHHAQEIDLRLAHAAALGALRGYEDPELVASIERVEALLAAIGRGPQQIPGLLKLALLHTNQLQRAYRYADALLGVVEPLDIAPLQMAGYILRGMAAIVCATVPEACADLRRALEIADTIELSTPKTTFDMDPLSLGCSTYALALVLAGKPDTAAALVERGVRRAHELAHPRTQASVLQIGATAFYFADDPLRAGELSAQCIEVVDGRGFHQIEVSARVLAAWARARHGDRAATAAMEEVLTSAERHGVVAGIAHLYFAAADAHLRGQEYERALEQVSRGEEFMDRSGERFRYEPQANVIRAQVLLSAGRPLEEVEPLLLHALALLERYQCPWMLLLVATLLGRVAVKTGRRRDEARERLALLYAGFDEGFETERLCDARAMLAQLARG
jgi:TOMM system kinase/cyclase fusion protein